MKTVFDNRQCAHVWAQQSQPYGRSNSMEFDGTVIKSYQTPVAAFAPVGKDRKFKQPIFYLDDGGRVVLVTCDSYSMTTASKHLPAVRRALRAEDHIYSVPDIGHGGGRTSTARVGPASDPKSWKPVHRANRAWMVAQYRATVASMLKSRRGIDMVESANQIRELVARVEKIRAYCNVFNIAFPAALNPLYDGDQVARRNQELRARADDPARAAAHARRMVARAEAEQRYNAERIDRFRRGERVPPFTAEEGALLRMSAGGAEVETSLGARVPLDEARAFLKFWDRCRLGGWARNLGTYSVGPFPLREIQANTGNVTIGCHMIHGHEIERIAPMIEAAQS